MAIDPPVSITNTTTFQASMTHIPTGVRVTLNVNVGTEGTDPEEGINTAFQAFLDEFRDVLVWDVNLASSLKIGYSSQLVTFTPPE